MRKFFLLISASLLMKITQLILIRFHFPEYLQKYDLQQYEYNKNQMFFGRTMYLEKDKKLI